jgi:cytochrome bd-type quinol oxidase subunit 1
LKSFEKVALWFILGIVVGTIVLKSTDANFWDHFFNPLLQWLMLKWVQTVLQYSGIVIGFIGALVYVFGTGIESWRKRLGIYILLLGALLTGLGSLSGLIKL